MTTQRQKKVAELLVKNSTLDNPLNMGEIVEKSRYSQSMVIKPSQVINSIGVQKELEVLGFNEVNAKQVVSEIMLNPETDANTRLKATDQVFKVQGTYAPDKTINVNVEIESSQEIIDLTKRLDELDKKQIKE